MRRSSTNELPEPVFFTDRDLGPSVAAALRTGGLHIEAYHEHFTLDNVPDGQWLRFVGERGWIALSHNKRIRYERDELDDLMTYGSRLSSSSERDRTPPLQPLCSGTSPRSRS